MPFEKKCSYDIFTLSYDFDFEINFWAVSQNSFWFGDLVWLVDVPFENKCPYDLLLMICMFGGSWLARGHPWHV